MADSQTVDSRIRGALHPLVENVEKGAYRGSAKTYIVFGYNTIPYCFGDDEPEYEKYLIWVRLVAPITQKITGLVREIKEALEAADFPWPSSTPSTDDEGSKQNVLFETEWVEAIGGEDDV